MPPKVRSTFSFNEQASNKLNQLASSTGVGKSEVLRRALALYEYMLQQRSATTGSVTVEKGDGSKVELLFP